MNEYFLNDLAMKVTDLMVEFNEEEIPELMEELVDRVKNKFYDLIAEILVADMCVWETRGYKLEWHPIMKVLK